MIQRDVSRRAPFGNEQLGDTSKQGLFTDINTVIMVAMNSNTSRHAISTCHPHSFIPTLASSSPVCPSLSLSFVLFCFNLPFQLAFLGVSFPWAQPSHRAFGQSLDSWIGGPLHLRPLPFSSPGRSLQKHCKVAISVRIEAAVCCKLATAISKQKKHTYLQVWFPCRSCHYPFGPT